VHNPPRDTVFHYLVTISDGTTTVTCPTLSAVRAERLIRLFGIGDSLLGYRSANGTDQHRVFCDSNRVPSGSEPNLSYFEFVAYQIGQQSAVIETLDSFSNGVGGSKTSDWLPAGDPAATNTHLATANIMFAASETKFNQAGAESLTLIDLGMNDSYGTVLVPAATFKTQIQTILATQLALGRKVLLISPHYPGLPAASGANWWTTDTINLLAEYDTKLRELHNGSTVFYISTGMYMQGANRANPFVDSDRYFSSGPHQGPVGVRQNGFAVARSILNQMLDPRSERSYVF
jgi:hypothetical protein